MFKIIPDPLFTTAVPLTVPGQDEQVKVSMTFKYKDKAALIDFEKRCMDKKTAIDELLCEIIDDWNEKEINAKCNKDSIKSICANYVMVPSEIITAYNKELVLSKAKN